MKTCSKCKQDKDDSSFHADQKSRDGLSSRCKDCKKEDRKKAYERNPITGAKWDQKHPNRAQQRIKNFRKRVINGGDS